MKPEANAGYLSPAFGIESGILAAAGHVPVDGTAHYQRNIQFQWDEHTQCKCQCGNLAEIEDDGQHCTDTVEQPGRTHTVHQRFDNGRHGIGFAEQPAVRW